MAKTPRRGKAPSPSQPEIVVTTVKIRKDLYARARGYTGRHLLKWRSVMDEALELWLKSKGA